MRRFRVGPGASAWGLSGQDPAFAAKAGGKRQGSALDPNFIALTLAGYPAFGRRYALAFGRCKSFPSPTHLTEERENLDFAGAEKQKRMVPSF